MTSKSKENKLYYNIKNFRYRLFEYAATHTLNELLTKTLDEVEDLTRSKIGFYHFIAKDQENIYLQSWSTRTKNTFCKAKGHGLHYKLSEAGVWVDCVRQKKSIIHNDYAGLPDKKGMPEGHAQVVRELVVPVLRCDKIVAVIGVGNKQTDYNQNDLEIMECLADFCWDVAERKQAEEQLRESEDRFRKLFLHAPMPYQSLDADGNFLDVNQTYLNVTGYTRDELIGRNFSDILSPDYKGRFKEGFSGLKTLGEVHEVEFELIKKDGSTISVSFSGNIQRDDQGRFLRTHCIFYDITDRKRADEALRGREHLFHSMFMKHSAVMLLVDPQTGKILNANHAAEAYYGYPRAEVLQMKIQQINTLPAEDIKNRMRHAADRKTNIFEFQHRLADGQIRDVEIHSTPITLKSERVLFSIIQDITERKAAETELRQTASMLESLREVHSLYIRQEDPQPAFDSLLKTLISMTDSAFGFLNEVVKETDGAEYKRNLAISNISWDHDSEMLYHRLCGRNLEFCNLSNLPGLPAILGEPVIANDVPNDARSRGIPAGHPLIRTFMGLPIFYGGKIVGVVGVANRSEGYSKEMARFLEPYLNACGTIIAAVRLRAREEAAVAALKASEEKYRLLIETTNDGVCAMNADHETTYINPAMARMLGYEISEAIGRKTEDFFFPEDMELHRARMRQRRAGEDEIYERRLRRKDGSPLWTLVSAKALLDEQGGFIGSFAIFADITARKLADNQLRASEENLRSLFNAINESAFLIDRNGIVIAANNTFADRLNKRADECVGKAVYSLIPDETAKQRNVFVEKVIQTGLPVQFQDERQGRWMYHSLFPIISSSGQVTRIAIFAQDITESKKNEEKIHQLQKTESLGRMAGAVAHHYNNLLAVVMANLEIVMQDLPGGSMKAGELADAMRAARRASKLGEMMLAYIGRAVAERKPLDLAETCRIALARLRADMPANITLETDLPDPGPVIMANDVQMRRIVENLVSNAREAIDNLPGIISVNVRTVPASNIPPDNRRPVTFEPSAAEYARLEVADTGCGIGEDIFEKLFDPFYSTRFVGRGLGLPVVFGAVSACGGCITVTSTLGKGSRFSVFLPLTAAPFSRLEPAASGGDARLEGAVVLLIDDDALVRRSARRILSRLGMTVIEAENGANALEIFRKQRREIRCVLCDLTMPGMNGWETLDALRSIDPDVPVILSSGYDECQVMGGGQPERPQVFLHKPYSTENLKMAMETAAGMPQTDKPA